MSVAEPSKVEQQWLNEREVSEMLHISLSKLRQDRFYRRGLPYSKFGKAVRYALDDVLKFMDSLKIIAA